MHAGKLTCARIGVWELRALPRSVRPPIVRSGSIAQPFDSSWLCSRSRGSRVPCGYTHRRAGEILLRGSLGISNVPLPVLNCRASDSVTLERKQAEVCWEPRVMASRIVDWHLASLSFMELLQCSD